ncbi:cyclic lactone autoinducer peptide [Lacrimispora sphenoides]|jgi:cyclic lactone autoinducer peptide|uniref:Cyclic lactone autoinducer peptide n=1 Tax=Lacrimispora sphenoides JCM 1415 TaxID=1297793 RepID=A0ABY1C2E2_9FIRM|nr:cyclic lactone autoinducer peptide [Lacrimispora sphenoides]SET56671.1 cyclic lactone autoinducer peptide [[Clostridium] sphenoides JCM 1415]SEU22838.1 cyclic lactone autoinducer peptide [Lacrimispora sphenoides]SUY49798.1 cyclic lactone autoinducer peptide [Lacrimispora sphenoides]
MSKITKKLKSQNWTVFMMNALALLVVAQNVNAACAWLQHQPEVPEEAKRFRKF